MAWALFKLTLIAVAYSIISIQYRMILRQSYNLESKIQKQICYAHYLQQSRSEQTRRTPGSARMSLLRSEIQDHFYQFQFMCKRALTFFYNFKQGSIKYCIEITFLWSIEKRALKGFCLLKWPLYGWKNK